MSEQQLYPTRDEILANHPPKPEIFLDLKRKQTVEADVSRDDKGKIIFVRPKSVKYTAQVV
jgi:hypothetical protein